MSRLVNKATNYLKSSSVKFLYYPQGYNFTRRERFYSYQPFTNDISILFDISLQGLWLIFNYPPQTYTTFNHFLNQFIVETRKNCLRGKCIIELMTWLTHLRRNNNCDWLLCVYNYLARECSKRQVKSTNFVYLSIHSMTNVDARQSIL